MRGEGWSGGRNGRSSPAVEVIALPTGRQLARRGPQLLLGIVLLGAGIALMVRARLGLSPWDVLHQGISSQTGIDFGTVVILVGVAVLLAWIPLRQRIGIGTVLNTALVGLVADGVLQLVPTTAVPGERVALLGGGVLILGLGTGLYIGAGLGPGPRDGLMTALAARGAPIWVVRTVLEASALALGWALGGNVGVGTVLFAFAIGPLAHVFIARFHLGPEPPGVEAGIAGD